ncbi:40S ribosomal protein mrp2, mitochondrial [Mucor velutinosus]|uniref:RNA-directed DNA polymerase n=1 Tax=Mucor velutinosus TaxID=708070 RepID=A0AAN7D4B2_9FUNG|nr:40S ribosomal protein mrp2, mitochondrial [Mucor velutinosus]
MSDNTNNSGSPSVPSAQGSPAQRQPGDDTIEHTRQQVQAIHLDQSTNVGQQPQPSNHQEDIAMMDATPLRSSPVSDLANHAPNDGGESSSQVTSHLSASTSCSSGNASSSAAGSSTLNSIKKLVWRRDSFVRLLLDMVEGTDMNNEHGQKHIEDMRSKIEDLNRLISTVKHSAKLSESNVTASLTGDNEGISLSKQDLPKFQLRSHATKYFPNEISYDSIHHFLRSFEKVISSSGKAVENVWRRYIPLTIPYDLDLWLNQDLLTAKSWSMAKEKFTSKFSNAALRLDARREVQTATMRSGETTEEYYNRFARAMMEAGYSSEDTTLGDTFLLGFPNEWQIQINAVLGVHFPGCSNFTASQIVTCAMNVLNSQKCPVSFVNAKRHGGSRASSSSSGSSGFSSSAAASSSAPRYYCSNHGGSQARHHEKDCRLNKGGSSSRRVVEKANVPKKASGNTFCKWCGKTWFHGHSCPEYQAMKGSFKVLSVRRENSGHRPYTTGSSSQKQKRHSRNGKGKQKDSGSSESDLFREAMEDKECKSSTSNKNTFNLITPLLLNNIRIIGKVDPGSDVSIINKSVLNKKFSTIKNIKALGGYLTFLSMNKDGSASKAERIGSTEPIKVTYMNGITFEHSFEIIDFNDSMAEEFDVLLGVDILPRLNIYLSGVAHCFPDTENEIAQFKNINYDTENVYNPENADYGTSQERHILLQQIEQSLNANKNIPADAVCSMPESVVHVPISNPKDCFIRQYPLSINSHAEIDKQIKEWLQNKIVERCKPSSVFHSPLITVTKKDENDQPTKLRVCCDLRRINASIDDNYHENYAVPKIHEIFERVSSSARIISKIDLHQAYYSYGVHEASRNALIFSHNGIFYRWCRAPFGLKFMSSLFVKCMSILFTGLSDELKFEMEKNMDPSQVDPTKVWGGIEHYIDDCVLHSICEKSHIKLINLAVNRLTSVNLRINVKKCSWFQTSVFLLGFVVGPGIQKIDMRRLSDIDEWPIPKTAKQVRSLMGVVSHLRNFCPMLSKVAEPIDSLRNDSDVKKNWTQLHTDRFNTIKQILLSNQILHAPVLDDKMFLQCDASLYGIAACLYQKDKLGRIKHIAFVSRSLNSAERNWSTNRRECAAVVFGFIKFRSLLWGHNDIEVLTDHLALTYMFTSTSLNSTLQSYLEILGEFHFTISHVKGIENVLCDALSRVYSIIDEDKWLEDENDRQMRKLHKLILIKRDTNKKIEVNRQRTVYSQDRNLNVLAVKLNSKEFQNSTTDYIAPPEADRAQIIKDAHKIGHFGIESVVQHIHTYLGLHWNTIYADCKEILKACPECAKHNVARRGFNPAKSIVSFDAFDHIAMDILGPMSITDKGNVYVLVVIDLCTRYIIARPIPNKNGATVAQAILSIYGDYGVAVSIQQADNGKEFKSNLMDHFTKTLGIKQRHSLPYYKQSNGSAENAIKQFEHTLRKMCGNDTHNWDDRVPIVQLALNMKVKERTANTPFSLMFARQVNVNPNPNKLNLNGRPALSIQELQQRIEHMNTIVFPALQERTQRLAEEYNKRMDKRRYILPELAFDSPVMVRLEEGRSSKLAPLYAGPYFVVKRTQAGNYILKDETNSLMHREYTPSELKPVNIDETTIEDEIFEVEDIRDHRYRDDDEIEYLVKWAGYSERENEYITADLFSSPIPIKKYWEKVKLNKELQHQRHAPLPTNKRPSKQAGNKRKAGTDHTSRENTRRKH